MDVGTHDLVLSTSGNVKIGSTGLNPHGQGRPGFITIRRDPDSTGGGTKLFDLGGPISAGGDVTVTGMNAHNDQGAEVKIAAAISSATGDVLINGTGNVLPPTRPTRRRSDDGVDILTGGEVATDSGTLTIVGKGGAGATLICGVYVGKGRKSIPSPAHQGGRHRGGIADQGHDCGVLVTFGGQIHATGKGTVTVVGTGGASPSGGDNYGVQVNGISDGLQGSQISSTEGAVVVTGTGGGTADDPTPRNCGVVVDLQGEIWAGGTVTIKGTGGLGDENNNDGIVVASGGGIGFEAEGTVKLTGTSGNGSFCPGL